MLSICNTIILLLVCVLFYVILTVACMLAVRFNKTKRSWKKIKEEYPYFSYPLYKKIFFLGLNGRLPKFFVVISFILNILLGLIFVLSLWNLISMSFIISQILKYGAVAFVLLNIIRGTIICCIEIKL